MEWRNKNLEEYISIVLNKYAKDILPADLERITSIHISNFSSKTGKREYDIEELNCFPNLERVVISSSALTKQDFQSLGKLLNIKNFEFQDCIFEEDECLSTLTSAHSISFTGCFHRNLGFIKELKELESLTLEKPYNRTELDVNDLVSLEHLKSLMLNDCILINQDSLDKVSRRLVRLSLFGINLDSFHFVDVLPDNASLFLPEDAFYFEDIKRNQDRIRICSNFHDFAYEEEEKHK